MNLFLLIFFFILFVVFAVFVVNLMKRSEGGQKSSFEKTKEKLPEKLPFKLVWNFFNKSEEAFFYKLKKSLPEGYYIFPKVRIIDFIEPIKGISYNSSKGKVWSRHVDFLICNSYFKPVLVLELNGRSHQRQDRINSDDFKKQLFESVGLKYKFIKVGESFEYSIKALVLEL